jgi:hypothetical protein
MADALSIDRLRLRLTGSSSAEARRFAEKVAEALAASVPVLEPGTVFQPLRVSLPVEGTAQPDGTISRRIADAVVRALGAAES